MTDRRHSSGSWATTKQSQRVVRVPKHEHPPQPIPTGSEMETDTSGSATVRSAAMRHTSRHAVHTAPHPERWGAAFAYADAAATATTATAGA